MPRSADQILVTEDGEILVEGRDARFRLRGQAGRYWLLSEEAGVLILRKVQPGEEPKDEIDALFDSALDLEGESESLEEGGRVIVAGEILSSMTLFQIIEVIANRNWQGDLRVFASNGDQFTLSLDQGALRHARSNSALDRLGQTLLAEGVLDDSQLQQLLGSVDENRRLGQLVLERGLLDQEGLYRVLGNQIRGIFFRTLFVHSGSYVFTSPDGADAPPAHTVHLPVQGLLMEGIQRVDEMELFRERIPSDDVVLRPSGDKGDEGLDDLSTAVYHLADGTRTLREIAEQSGLDEFKVTKAAYYLSKNRRVAVEAPQRVDVTALKKSAAAFNQILQDIFGTISLHGGGPTARQTLGAWIMGSGYEPYFGEGLEDDGSFDESRLVQTLQSSRAEDPLETLHQVGHELVSFALFSAGTVLPREAEKQLSYEVNQRLQQIRGR